MNLISYQRVRSFKRFLHLTLLLAGLPFGGPVPFDEPESPSNRISSEAGGIKKIGTGAEGGAMGADHKCGRRGNWVPVAVLRCKQIIRPERLCSKGTKAKRQSPVRGSAVYRLVSGL